MISQMGQKIDLTGSLSTQSGFWIVRIWLSLLAMTPFQGVACLLLYLVSQVMFLAALLLPWKILVILSAGTVPASLYPLFQGFQARNLVLVLSIATIVAFALHFLCEIAIDYLCQQGAGAVLDSHRKTGLFNDYRRQAIRLYRQLLRSLAATLCCLSIGVMLLLFYPLLLVALMSYLLLSVMAFRFCVPLLQDKGYRPSPELIARAWWGTGFLYMIGWMIWDYWREGLPHLVVAFVGLILARQALVFLSQLLRNLQFVADDHRKVEALFLADVPLLPRARPRNNLQQFILMGEQETWIREVLASYHDHGVDPLDTSVRIAEAGRVVYVTVRCAGNAIGPAFMIKLFHQSHEALARHEMEILQVAEGSWPAPRLLGAHGVVGHTCLVFEWAGKADWLSAAERIACLLPLRERLMACRLPGSLAERYERSHPRLSKRLENVDWLLLKMLAPSEAVRDLCIQLEVDWRSLLDDLENMPSQIVLPALDRRMMTTGDDDDDAVPFIANWTRWRFEPMGAGWPFRQRSKQQLRHALQRAAITRAELRDLSPDKVFLAALLYEFDRLNAEGNFAAMLALVETISTATADFAGGDVSETDGVGPTARILRLVE